MAGLSLKNITKYYQNGHVVVKDFNLEIEDHDFVVLVGPGRACAMWTHQREW